MATGTAAGIQGGSGSFLFVAVVTLMVTVLASVYLRGRGFIGMVPILIGAIVGYVIAVPFGMVDASPIAKAPLFAMPNITFPSLRPLAATAIFSISIMALATIPESTAHLYQISLYVDRTAEELGRPKYHLDKNIGFNLILDGIGDFLHGLIGATAGTNYGENNSLMAITRNYSGPALLAAGVICILLAFVGVLAEVVRTCRLRHGDSPFTCSGSSACRVLR
jgi:uracil permease